MNFFNKGINEKKKREQERKEQTAKEYVLSQLEAVREQTRQQISVMATKSEKSANEGRQTEPKYQQFNVVKNMPIKREYYRSKRAIEMLYFILNVTPDGSQAKNNYLRLANKGHYVEVVGFDGAPNEEGENYINNDLAPRIGRIYGKGADGLVDVLNLSAYVSGAEAMEVELTESLDDVVDFHIVSPESLKYIQKEDGTLQLAQQMSDGTTLELNDQVRYIPIDPMIDDPYGVSPIIPALQALIFQKEFIDDLKAVAHHQGHARMDVSIVSEHIIASAPDSIKTDPKRLSEFVDSQIDAIRRDFEELEPTSDFFHTDGVQVDMAGGTQGKSMDFGPLMTVVDRQVMQALKQLPILMGRNESTTETHGSIQWQIFVDTIEAWQNVTKRMLEWAYNLALQVKGIPARASVTFEKVRAEDRKAEAEAYEIEIRNNSALYQQGIIDQETFAVNTTGEAPAEEAPRSQASTGSALTNFGSLLEQYNATGTEDGAEETTGRNRSAFPY